MKITITKREFNQFYIYNYFDAPKKIIRIMRMYMGPTLTLVSMYLLYKYGGKINAYLLGFVLAYGIFYTVKPLIMLWALRAKEETFSFEIKDFKLNIKDRLNEGIIDLRKSKIQENKKYFFVNLDNKQVIFFPKDKLNENTRLQFTENKIWK